MVASPLPSDAELSLVYVSEAVQPFAEEGLRTLADRAAERNRSIGVTGYLYYSQARFVQYLEGEPPVVEDLLARIRDDERHEILTVAREPALAQRRFPDWGMRWLRESEAREIDLEAILAEHLLFKSRAQLEEPAIDATIVRMVTRVAENRAKLSARYAERK